MNDLGVLIDENLSFNEHIADKINKAFKLVGIRSINRKFHDIDKNTFILLYCNFYGFLEMYPAFFFLSMTILSVIYSLVRGRYFRSILIDPIATSTLVVFSLLPVLSVVFSFLEFGLIFIKILLDRFWPFLYLKPPFLVSEAFLGLSLSI